MKDLCVGKLYNLNISDDVAEGCDT